MSGPGDTTAKRLSLKEPTHLDLRLLGGGIRLTSMCIHPEARWLRAGRFGFSSRADDQAGGFREGFWLPRRRRVARESDRTLRYVTAPGPHAVCRYIPPFDGPRRRHGPF